MALPCTQQDLERKKFVECPVDSGQPAIRTKICQDEGEVLSVEFDVAGSDFNIYSEVNSVAGLATVTILDYTIPVGKKVKIRRVDVSGENVAAFLVEANATTISKKRTYYTSFNTFFEFKDLTYNAGENIKIIVENNRNSVSDFNANLQGNIEDA